tara:strand:- start:791 stop:1216 length:426 start_codon:yes stop_codon:yes gene_type:complete
MKNNTYEVRLAEWSNFRKSLEASNDPIQNVIDYYKKFPVVSIHTDPYDMTSWPDPWELIYENEYCEYCILLGMCYTLQLTDRFSTSDFEIHITLDEINSEHYYLLYVEDRVLGYEKNKHVSQSEINNKFISQCVYQMPQRK